MDEQENLKKNQKYLDELANQGKFLDLKICPRCKSPRHLRIMDVVGFYAPLGPSKYICDKCGWTGRTIIEMSNRPITEQDEEMMEEIIDIFSEEPNEED